MKDRKKRKMQNEREISKNKKKEEQVRKKDKYLPEVIKLEKG